tara:strand:- start:27 stop:221 length:195 start_codon:yes stop_codon:yes gene_type:complete
MLVVEVVELTLDLEVVAEQEEQAVVLLELVQVIPQIHLLTQVVVLVEETMVLVVQVVQETVDLV